MAKLLRKRALVAAVPRLTAPRMISDSLGAAPSSWLIRGWRFQNSSTRERGSTITFPKLPSVCCERTAVGILSSYMCSLKNKRINY
jgi:hypothetical protein